MAIACQVIQGAVDQARGNLPFTGRVCRHAWLDNMLLNDSVDRSNVGATSDLADYMPVEPGLNVGHELGVPRHRRRSEEHTSELQSLMRISYAVFCLKNKTTHHTQNKN